MRFKLSEIAATIPSGGKIVSMVESQGYLFLATEQHVFKGSVASDDFEQMCFRMLEETEDEPR